MKQYFIGQGTGVIKEFETLEEMIIFHKGMDSLNRHFCKLYDRQHKRYADGWKVQYDYSNKENWNEWV